MKSTRISWLVTALLAGPMMMGAEGGCKRNESGFLSRTPAPSMEGDWQVEYADDLKVEVEIGGAIYTKDLGVNGGKFSITHEGKPFDFDLDCSKDNIICPTEQYPELVTMTHKNEKFPHHFYLQVPKQECVGKLVDAEPAICGTGTNNPECDQVCDGEVKTVTKEAFGVVNEKGTEMSMLLGGGIATNGINCALLAISGAKAILKTTGSADDEDWKSIEMNEGEIVVGYTGRCLWAGDPEDDGDLEALVLGANLKISTSFSAKRAE